MKAVARALRSRGVLPWLDEWELPPGQPWQPLLEKQIGQIRSAAVFVGLAGVGPWQEQEIYGFLREFVARRSAVIPVLLDNAPSAPDLPIFLRAMTYVDFRLREPDPMVRLEWGITGRAAGLRLSARGASRRRTDGRVSRRLGAAAPNQSKGAKLVGSASRSCAAFSSIQALATATTRSCASAGVRNTSRSINRCERVRVPSSATIATRAR